MHGQIQSMRRLRRVDPVVVVVHSLELGAVVSVGRREPQVRVDIAREDSPCKGEERSSAGNTLVLRARAE